MRARVAQLDAGAGAGWGAPARRALIPPASPCAHHPQGPSPDEVALVDAARQMGFAFMQRTQTGVTLCMLGQEVTYEILNVMEYTSDR